MNRNLLPALVAFGVLGGGQIGIPDRVSAQSAEAPERLDCDELDCAAVLPEASRFEQSDDRAYATGLSSTGEPVGWVVLSTDVVDIPAYSGKPLVTLVGLRPDATIAGAKVVHHSEPILLVGIPESALHGFVDRYAGLDATARVVVGRAPDDETIAVDVISGATVTALAQNRTILESARVLGAAVGVVDARSLRRGHFVREEQPWSWERMVDEGVFGRLTVTETDMDVGDEDTAFVDLWFTIVDAPQVGRALLGDGNYEHLIENLEDGEHLFVVLGNGTSSFKGSAFVRGGIFDRVRVEQGLTELVFRDTDYDNLSRVAAPDAPRFEEGAVFVTRGATLDPGAELTLVFLGSRYDHRGGYSREFREFSAAHRLPESVYAVEGGDDEPIWVQAWRNRTLDVIALSVFLLLVASIFVLRRWTTANEKWLDRLHVASMVVSFLMVGVYMGAQPSVTQVLTLIDGVVEDLRVDLFLSEPLIFVSWIFIAITSLVWGRGVFCGWVCPYGAMTELLHRIGKRLHLPRIELPDRWHRPLRYLRYVVLFGLVPVFLWDSVLGERLAEIEPFKSTFLVPAWTRHWGFFAWWGLLLVAAAFWYRPFCRYLCPLGGGLALFNSFRLSGPRRRAFCSKCKICTRGCEPRAIRDDGTIDPRECLSCMECESNYRNDEVCPPLVALRRIESKPGVGGSERERQRLRVLQNDVRDV